MKNKAGYLRDVRLLADHAINGNPHNDDFNCHIEELSTDYRINYDIAKEHVNCAIQQECNV